MTDCASAPEIYIPDFEDMPQGVRFLLTVLRVWADARGSIDASEAELAAYTGMGESTVRRHLAWAAKEGRAWVSRSERRRHANGHLGGYRYWLRLEKFGQTGDHRSIRAVDHAVGCDGIGAVGDAADWPPPNASGGADRPPLNPSAPPLSASGGAPDSSGGEGPENAGFVGVPRERARAALPLPSCSHFLSFPWRDEATRKKAETILASCGEGLGDLGLQQGRVLKSLAYVLEPGGVWAGFDLDLDIVPVVKRKTGPGRKSPLWDFALLIDNLDVQRARRLRPVRPPKSEKVKAFAPAPDVEPAEARAKRMASLRGIMRAIDGGMRPLWALPKDKQRLTGAWLDDAFAEERTCCAKELAGLELEAGAQASATAPATRVEG